MYEKGDSIIDSLKKPMLLQQKVFCASFIYTSLLKNDFKLVHSHLPKSDIVVGIITNLLVACTLFQSMLNMGQERRKQA